MAASSQGGERGCGPDRTEDADGPSDSPQFSSPSQANRSSTPASAATANRPSASSVRCVRSLGDAAFRAYPALTCDTCAFSVCITCFSRGPSGASRLREATCGRVRCHHCDGGLLCYDEVPVFPWVCEEMAGAEWRRRITNKKMTAFHFRATQQFHLIRSMKESRAATREMSVLFRSAQHTVAESAGGPAGDYSRDRSDVVGVDSDVLQRFAAVAVAASPSHTVAAHPSRGPCVVEGGSFVFVVTNRGLAADVVWCGASHAPRRAVVAGAPPPMRPRHEEEEEAAEQRRHHVTLTPLLRWTCPPSLEGVPDAPQRMRCPLGACDALGFDSLQLFRVNDFHAVAAAAAGDGVAGALASSSDDEGGSGARLPATKSARGDANHLLDLPLPRGPCKATPAPGQLPGRARTVKAAATAAAAGAGAAAPRPLLTVAIIHRLAQAPVAALTAEERNELRVVRRHAGVPTPAGRSDGPEREGDGESNSNSNSNAGGGEDAPWVAATDGLLFAIDSVAAGRNVAVLGLGSKIPFLRLVFNAVEFLGWPLHILEGYDRGGSGVGGGRSARLAAALDAIAANVVAFRQSATHARNLRRRQQRRVAPGENSAAAAATHQSTAPVLQLEAVTRLAHGAAEGSGRSCVSLVFPRPWPPGANDPMCGVLLAHSGKDLPVPRVVLEATPGAAAPSERRATRQVRNFWQSDRSAGQQQQGNPMVAPWTQLLVIHGIDHLEAAVLARVCHLCEEHASHVTVLCSVDDPHWLREAQNASVAALLRFAVVVADGPIYPAVLETAAADGRAWERKLRGRPAALPMADTVRRVLLSLPAAFRAVLRVMLDLQLECGGDARLNINAVMDFLAERRRVVTTSRMRSMIHELVSNRLATHDVTMHSIRILQPALLVRALDEMAGDGA